MSDFIALNGQRFFLRTWGDVENPPLLMLHGFPEYSGAWDEVATRLRDRFYCIAPDQRGYGQSYAPTDVADYHIQHLVSDLVALIDHIGGPIDVVGHDWGASAAYALAIARPDLLRKLVILNGVHPIPFQRALIEDADRIAASQYILWLQRAGSEQVLAADEFAKLQAMFAGPMNLSWLDKVQLKGYLAAWKDASGLKAMINWYRATGLYVPELGGDITPPAPLDPDMMRITVPHLLIWGTDDTALLPSSYAGLDALCDAFALRKLKGADHWLHHQKPDEVAVLIRDFI